MKTGDRSSESKTALAEKIDQLSKAQKISIYTVCILLLVGVFGYFSYYPAYQQITRLSSESKKLDQQLAKARANARQLKTYRERIRLAEARFAMAKKVLPERQEVPSLLASISQAGNSAGLEFALFEPKKEVTKNFYAELPVSIRVTGSYHKVAMFFDKVSRLARIVNIRDITMRPLAKSAQLATSCTAVTYKFVEKKQSPSQKGRNRSKNRRNRKK